MSDPGRRIVSRKARIPTERHPNEQPGYAAASPPNTPWSPRATGWEQRPCQTPGPTPKARPAGRPNPPGPPPTLRTDLLAVRRDLAGIWVAWPW